MSSQNLITRPERPSDAPAIDALHRVAFGPGAYARAAYRVREQAPHDAELSFVTECDGTVIASVRMTPIRVGDDYGYLLGPLVVEPSRKGQGFGKALMRHVVEAARSDCRFILLVGDLPYYYPFGFRAVPPNRVSLPGPVDPARVLVAEFVPGTADALQGMVEGVRPGVPRARQRARL
jgi:predicted N-acetyltransferase YhbS